METLSDDRGDKYRSYISGESEANTQWRFGAPPNYDMVNKLFEEGRTQEWPVGSLEERVQRLIKSFEMEAVHKIRPEDFKTLDLEKYRFYVNGRLGFSLDDIRRVGGSYNAFLQTSLPKEQRIYDPDEESALSAMKAFTDTFTRGFALEILKVYSGPPSIAYKFRHWGYMEGPFKGHPQTGEKVEFYGMGIIEVNEDMKIEKMEFFYDRGELLAGLVKGAASANNSASPTSACPFLEKHLT